MLLRSRMLQSGQFPSNRVQCWLIVGLRYPLCQSFNVVCFSSTSIQQCLDFSETISRLSVLPEINLSVVAYGQTWVKRNRNRRLIGLVIIDDRCLCRPAWQAMRYQKRSVVLIRQIALQFLIVLSEVGDFLGEFPLVALQDLSHVMAPCIGMRLLHG